MADEKAKPNPLAAKPQQPLIVLIDGENQCVHLYGQFTRTIVFEDIFLLNVFLEGKEVYYVESLFPCQSGDIMDIVRGMWDDTQEIERRYIHCLVEDYVRIPELKMTFAGPKDCKPLDRYGYDLFEKSPTLKRYLIEGRVEILTESEVNLLKKRRPDPKAKDKSLDSILLNKPVDKAMTESSMFDDPNVDEITDKNSEGVMTDNEAILNRHSEFGKKE